MNHETQQSDDRLSGYDYYLMGGETPVRVLLDQDGSAYGAEKPGKAGEWLKAPTILSKIERHPEEFEKIGENEFNLRTQAFVPKTISTSRPGM